MIAERRVRVRTACAHSPQGLPREKARARSFLPRGVSRQAGGAAAMRVLKGDGFCRGAPRGRRIPPDFRHPCRLSWHPDGRAATRLPKGDASCRETAQGRRPAPDLFSLAGSRGRPAGQLPRIAPRVTVFAMKRPEGDGFRPISVSLTGFRDVSEGRLPRGCPRETLLAARPPKGEGPRPFFSPSRASVASRGEQPAARKRPAPKGRPPTQNYVRVLELTGSARQRGKKKCKRRTRCTRPR